MYVTYVYKQKYADEVGLDTTNTIQVYGDRPIHWAKDFVCFIIQDPAIYGDNTEVLAINSDCLIHYFTHMER